MNIGLDLTWMSLQNQSGGVFQYGMRVLTALTNYTDNTIIAIVDEGCEPLFCHLKSYDNFRLIIKTSVPLLTSIVEQEKIDVIHTPIQQHVNFTLAVPMITTLHDLQPFYFPEFFSPKEIELRNINYRKSAEFSERVIVSYQHVKDDLIKFYDIPPEKIDICGHGMAGPVEVTTVQISAVRRKYDLPESYIFYSANTWRHKNHIGLLRGLKSLRERQGVKVPLVCTGFQYPDFFPQIEEEVRMLGLVDSVRFLGYLPEEEMPAILSGATLAVIPTLYEAGSYPLMEAMNYGIPAICSTATSLPDTIGDLRFVFDPNSPEDMAEKMAMMLTDERMREANVANSAARVKEWRWAHAVKPYIDSYRSAIDGFEEKKRSGWFMDWAANYEYFVNNRVQPLVDEVMHLRAYAADLERERSRFNEIIAALSGVKAAIYSSLSWRITKPLRWVGKKLWGIL